MVLSLLVGLTFPACAPAATSPYPAKTWRKVESSEALGWSSAKLNLAQAYSEEIGSEAVMIVADGEILDEWGDTTRKINIRSLMKPLMNALYGIAVQEGQINIQSTLAELGVDDKPPALTPAEKQARIVDLLQARSGVYHGSDADTLMMIRAMPERGSHPPGTFWYYHNWDFCALGAIYEQTTQRSLFADFDRLIAKPLAIEDFTLADTGKGSGPVSLYPWYGFTCPPVISPALGCSTCAKGNGRAPRSSRRSGSRTASSPIPMPVNGGAAAMACSGGSPYRESSSPMWRSAVTPLPAQGMAAIIWSSSPILI